MTEDVVKNLNETCYVTTTNQISTSLFTVNLKFLISFLFNHLDTDKDDKLTREELRNALTADGLQYFSTECTMEEFMRADRNTDNRLVAPELYDVFGKKEEKSPPYTYMYDLCPLSYKR